MILKNNTLLLLFLLVSLIACRTANISSTRTDLQNENLKGKVKAVRLYVDSTLVEYKRYNKKGFLLEHKGWTTDKQLLYHQQYFYTSSLLKEILFNGPRKAGFKIGYTHNTKWQKIIVFELDAKADTLYTTSFEYDDSGRVVKQVYHYKNDTAYSYHFEYRPNTINEYYSRSGLLSTKILDTQGRVLQLLKYNPDNKTEYKYNEWGDVIDDIQISQWGIDYWKYKYEYDKQRNWILKAALLDEGNRAKYERKRVIEYY